MLFFKLLTVGMIAVFHATIQAKGQGEDLIGRIWEAPDCKDGDGQPLFRHGKGTTVEAGWKSFKPNRQAQVYTSTDCKTNIRGVNKDECYTYPGRQDIRCVTVG